MQTKTPFLMLTLTSLLFFSCAAPRPPKIPDTMALFNVPPEDIVSPAEQVKLQDEFTGLDMSKTYSLTVKNAEIKDTLLLLSRKTGYTIIADKDVSGRVTTDFQDKTLRDILFALLKPAGYTAYGENTVIYVSRPRLITRTFSVNYNKGKRSSTSTMNASVAETGSTGYAAAGGSINLNLSTGTGGSGGSGVSSDSSSSPQGSVTVRTSGESDFWSEMIRGLEVIIFGDSGGGGVHGGSRADKSGRKLVVNDLAGLIFVSDYSDNMEHIKAYLDDVEKAVKRQVLIQAHIVEVSLSDSFAYGIDWSYLRTLDGNNPTTVKLSQGLMPPIPSQVFQLSIANNKVSALLDAMKEVGQVNTLSSPKISTMNNQKAVIKLTTKEISWLSNAVYNAQGQVAFKYSTPQVDEVGIFLDVTPQINEQGAVSMQIHPSISEKSSTSTSPDGTSSKPIIDIREVDTMIEVRNGETVVIAGLIVDKILETKRSVPFLGDIPYLGALFRYTSQEKKKTELVILITPYLLTEKSIADIRREHEERLKKVGRPFLPTPTPN